MTDPELIQAAITASGLSARRFAHLVAFGRDERTVRRWQSGEVAIPEGARERLHWLLALAPGQRQQLVELLEAGALTAA